MCTLAFRDRVISIRGECGQRLWFRPSEYPRLLRGIGYFERNYLLGWRGLLQPNERIADIGANIGLTAQRFYSLCHGQCRIDAFEPSPRNLRLLERNITEIGGDRITVCAQAVGDTEGEVLFAENIEHGGLSRLASLDSSKPKKAQFWKHVNQIKVKVVTLDNYFPARKPPDRLPTLLKIDVEGAGGKVLAGAAQLLNEQKPALTCSFHGREESDAIRRSVAACGYIGVGFSPSSGWKRCQISMSEGCFVHPSDPRLERMGV